MSKPRWYSQPFPPEGASAAEGIRNQLGRPDLDLLTILVRESAQNSWDAAIGDRPVDYRINLRSVGAAHANAWRDLLQEGAPDDTRLPLRKSLRQSRIRVLEVSDRGTRGLGGPTRADSTVTERHDFVAFVRNVGEPRDTALGGGTYGFGKGIFYLLAKTGTVLVHTRCVFEGRYQTRLMGCALWQSYLAEDNGSERRYTGRHWWGDTSGQVVEPLLDEEAESAARRLGLEPFGEEETGTTVVVIDPKLDELDPDLKEVEERHVAEYLADTIAWQLWPKMLSNDAGQSAMRFSIECNGTEIPVPDPRETRPLNLFVAAHEKMPGSNGAVIQCLKPKRLLGRLGLVKRHAPPLEPTRAAQTAGIETFPHHICLMRSAELVVTYHPGPKPPSEYLSYAGVFKADSSSEIDHSFSRAEPPTHDAWNAHSLEYPDSTYVRTALRRIREMANELLGLDKASKVGSAKISLGAASTLLSPLVGGSWGIGGATDYGQADSTGSLRTRRTKPKPVKSKASKSGDSSGSEWSDAEEIPDQIQSDDLDHARSDETSGQGLGGDLFSPPPKRKRPRVQYLDEPYYDEHDGQAVLIQEFRLPVAGPQEVGIELNVAIAGGDETEPPIGAAMPELLGWYDGDEALVAEPTLITEGDAERPRRAVIRPAPDTMTDIQLRVKAVTS